MSGQEIEYEEMRQILGLPNVKVAVAGLRFQVAMRRMTESLLEMGAAIELSQRHIAAGMAAIGGQR